MINDLLSATPWPELGYIGLPAFLAGLATGWLGGSRQTKRSDR